MIIRPPSSEASGPVIDGWTALAISKTITRSKSVNWPTSRFPNRRSPISRAK